VRYFFSSPFGVVVLLELPFEPLLELLLLELPLLELLLLVLELLLLVLELLLFLSLLAFSSAFGFSAGVWAGACAKAAVVVTANTAAIRVVNNLLMYSLLGLRGLCISALARRIALKRITGKSVDVGNNFRRAVCDPATEQRRTLSGAVHLYRSGHNTLLKNNTLWSYVPAGDQAREAGSAPRSKRPVRSAWQTPIASI
jgi:hypothetical protein